jgi:predicted membrane channel-forming protein YqfA (hemolysin III family)
VFFFVSKIPERLAPGRFDIFPHSHTLFHISAIALTSIQMYVFPKDSQIRKTQLLEKISPSFMTLILPFLVMICVGLVQVLFLAFLLVRGVLVPHGAGRSTLSSLHGGPHTVYTPSTNGGPCHKPPLKKQQ